MRKDRKYKIKALFSKNFNISTEKAKFENYSESETELRKIQSFVSKNIVSFLPNLRTDLWNAEDILTWIEL